MTTKSRQINQCSKSIGVNLDWKSRWVTQTKGYKSSKLKSKVGRVGLWRRSV